VTVDAMLEAAVKLLRRGRASSITTNGIAETAGVSIGSVYQYFPNKNALFVALHERHIREVAGVIRRRLTECSDSSLGHLVESLVEGMVEVHKVDPELSELLGSEVPHHADGTVDFSIRFHEAFRTALAPHISSFGRKIDLDARAFVMANMLDTLGHAVVLRRPRGLSLATAKAESCKAILAYLVS
jgi:AcrR family transcriptional regulator